MAQQMVAQTNVLVYDPNGTTVVTAEWKKAYYSDTSATWRLAGDGFNPGVDDPGTAVTISLTQGLVSTIDSNFYYYYGDIATSYTYTLYVDTAPQAGLTGVMLFSMDLMPDIALNSTHRTTNDGTDHSCVVSNNTHRALVATNPHAVDTSLANGVNLPNVDNTSDVTKNAAKVTLTGKTLTNPCIPVIYQDNIPANGGVKALTLPADIDTLAVNDDMLTKAQMIEEMASGSENSITVLKALYTQIINSEKFAQMMTYAGYYTSHTTTPVGNITPTRILQFCVDTSTTPDNVYVSIGLTNTDWINIGKSAQYGTGAANTITPNFIGQVYVETDTSIISTAKGLTSSDWITVS